MRGSPLDEVNRKVKEELARFDATLERGSGRRAQTVFLPRRPRVSTPSRRRNSRRASDRADHG
jgi:hypothetical protein